MNQAADRRARARGRRATILGQPFGIATLFLTEMWERFTYYGMRALLILFMAAALSQGGLGIKDSSAAPSTGCTSAAPTCSGWPVAGWPTGCSVRSAP